jgi:spermidine synthase
VETVARATSPRGELVLRQRDDGHLELRVNGIFVIDTLEHSSEEALAVRALELAVATDLRVLVGGLGMGFTLRAALADPRVTHCTVAEIEPDLVGWLRDGTIPGGTLLLGDERVDVRVADVADVLRSASSSFDMVLLDVDNGPGYLVHEANAALYAPPALEAARTALAPGGRLVVWSAAAAPELVEALRRVFGNAEEHPYDVPRHGRVGRYFLYSAQLDRRGIPL